MSKKSIFILVAGLMFIVFGLGHVAAQDSGDPLTAFSTTFFVGSGDCASCHSSLTDSAGTDVSFDTNWQASMMANSAKDPLWQAKVESESLRTPSLSAAIEDKCATCHMPMAHTQATADGTSTAIFGDGFLSPSSDLHEAAMDGVSCAICHQIGDENLGSPGTFSGHFPIDTTSTRDRSIFGKYSDPSVNKMSGNFLAVYGPQVEDSALCATCHTLYTSAFDAAGNPLNSGEEFPEQTPYLEWEHSVYGDGVGEDTSCQVCHMPPISGSSRLTIRSSTPLRSNFGKHYFDGGNAFMLSILRDNGPELGVTASTADFNDAIVRSQALLAQETAVLNIEEAHVAGDQLLASLEVANLTGHKFPTGIPLRRSWIHLTLQELNGQALLDSGRPLANGDIAGNDADIDQAAYEPHYDLIDSDDQVQIYESIMGDVGDKVTYTLLRATEYLKDNRLLPEGFDKASAPDDIQVEGTAEDDANFTAGGDKITYRSAVSGSDGLVTITADLLFQPLSAAAAKDLDTDSAAGPHVAQFGNYYDTAGHTPSHVAAASGELQYKLLSPGWNMLSAVLDPQDADLEQIFAPIQDKVVLVKDAYGNVYWPQYGINNIPEWDPDAGYKVYMEDAAYFSLYGVLIPPESRPISLTAGWNLVSYLRTSPMPIEQALASCAGNLILAKDGFGRVYWPAFGINQIGEMKMGEAYQLYMTAPATLTYPAN